MELYYRPIKTVLVTVAATACSLWLYACSAVPVHTAQNYQAGDLDPLAQRCAQIGVSGDRELFEVCICQDLASPRVSGYAVGQGLNFFRNQRVSGVAHARAQAAALRAFRISYLTSQCDLSSGIVDQNLDALIHAIESGYPNQK